MLVAVFELEDSGEVVTRLARPGDNFSLRLFLLEVALTLELIEQLDVCFRRNELFIIGFCVSDLIGTEQGDVDADWVMTSGVISLFECEDAEDDVEFISGFKLLEELWIKLFPLTEHGLKDISFKSSLWKSSGFSS